MPRAGDMKKMAERYRIVRGKRLRCTFAESIEAAAAAVSAHKREGRTAYRNGKEVWAEEQETKLALEPKPKQERARLVYTSATPECMKEHDGKVFAVIGPFHGFDDKPELQNALRILMRGWNIKSDAE